MAYEIVRALGDAELFVFAPAPCGALLAHILSVFPLVGGAGERQALCPELHPSLTTSLFCESFDFEFLF